MSLSVFIEARMDEILEEWECFARRNAPEHTEMTDLALRDHAREILEAVAIDLATPQSDGERLAKSEGDADDEHNGRTAAAIHGALRQGKDYSLLQLSAEFRALRATVLRLWRPGIEQVNDATLEDVIRFNEAIDQALAQSIIAYSARADVTRDLFLAVLGHDLRSPLATVSMVGELLTRAGLPPPQVHELGLRAARSARYMRHMVDDLLSYTRMQMGRGIPTSLAYCDLAEIVRAAVADAQATHPGARFDCAFEGDTAGDADAGRVQQLLTNLLVNAAQHGGSEEPVLVSVAGRAEDIVLRVTNHGRVIAENDLDCIFKPLVQLQDGATDPSKSASLGLGLYVAREIASAHGGSIEVTSDAKAGTTFEVVLPRQAV